MHTDRDNVRDIDIRVRLSPKEYRKLCVIAQTRGLQFAAVVRALALEQAETLKHDEQHEVSRVA